MFQENFNKEYAGANRPYTPGLIKVPENFDNDLVSTSKFYMLRCIIAMAHADGVVIKEEIDYANSLICRLPLTEEQRNILDNDLEEEQDIKELLPYINDPNYRGQVVYFARIMAFKDGHLHPAEQALLDKLHDNAVDGLDMETIRAQAKRNMQAEMAAMDLERDMQRPINNENMSWMQWIEEILFWFGIDLMG